MRERVRRLFPNWNPKDKTRQVTQAATDYRSEMDYAAYKRVNRRMRQVRQG